MIIIMHQVFCFRKDAYFDGFRQKTRFPVGDLFQDGPKTGAAWIPAIDRKYDMVVMYDKVGVKWSVTHSEERFFSSPEPEIKHVPVHQHPAPTLSEADRIF